MFKESKAGAMPTENSSRVTHILTYKVTRVTRVSSALKLLLAQSCLKYTLHQIQVLWNQIKT